MKLLGKHGILKVVGLCKDIEAGVLGGSVLSVCKNLTR